jgi:hypothetical protein
MSFWSVDGVLLEVQRRWMKRECRRMFAVAYHWHISEKVVRPTYRQANGVMRKRGTSLFGVHVEVRRQRLLP